MSVGVRQLTVLGEFKPFGLIAEALDGKPLDNLPDKYDYFLFDPEIASERDSSEVRDAWGSSPTDRSDHELFIRGNRIIWSIGSRVFKRFTLPAAVIMASWCRLGDSPDAFLCVLLAGCLTIYSVSGDLVSIPLPQTVTSIWPLPFGLLLQQVADVNPMPHVPFSFSNPMLGARDISRPRKENRFSSQQISSSFHPYDHIMNEDTASASSHLILKDPLEELQLTYIEERGKLKIMKDFDERTIWTSDRIPLLASYNQGKMQHSVWVAEVINSNTEVIDGSLAKVIPAGVLQKQVSFRRIWQGKGARNSASKVFLATDDDGAPVICFLLQEEKKLLSVTLQTFEINNEIIFDIRPGMGWSLPAIAAASVIVTHPRMKAGLLPYSDIIILSQENALLLYSGKQCLCRYMLPSYLGRGLVSQNLDFSETTSGAHELKIIGLSDIVGGRINVIVNNGQLLRCVLRRSPSSLLANDCITAMAEGLSSDLYNHFLVLLWGDSNSVYLSEANSMVDSEWDAFCSIIKQMCSKSNVISKELSEPAQASSWEFLLNSKFHKDYVGLSSTAARSSGKSLDLQASPSSNIDGSESIEDSFYSELLIKSLDSLHAVYESLKLDNLRKRDLELLADLLCNLAKCLGDECYLDHYIRDFPSLSQVVGICTHSFSSRGPPSLFRWLDNCLQHGCNSASKCDLPDLIHKDGNSVVSWARKIISFYSVLCGAKPVGKKLSSGVYCRIAAGSYSTNEELTVLAMVGERFGLQQLDLLPFGVSLPLRHALDKCRESPPTNWPGAAYILLGREDLALSFFTRSCKSKEFETQTNLNLISMSTPYMLPMHPVMVPSSFSDTIVSDSTKFEDIDSTDGSTTDGMEHIFNSSTQLRYGRDLRLNEWNMGPKTNVY